MDIQTEVQKIHHQFGVSEKANYEIQKLFDKAIKEAVIEALRINDVSGSLCVNFEPRDDYSSGLCKNCGQSYLKHNDR
jgi:hypothetical protein